jgi:phage protein D
MSKSLFIKAWINGEDVADAVFYLRYESDVKKGDLIELRMKNINNLVNSKNLVAGARVEFQYGFIGDVQSSVHVARLSNIDRDYAANGLLLNIKAVDKGIELKKGTSQRIWNDVTLSEIAATIANEYGLDARVEPTQKKYHSIPQGGQSEWEFLNYLVEREHGNYHLQITDYTLYLEKNKRSKAAKRKFVYGENIVSLMVQLKEVTQKPMIESFGTQTKGIDPKTGLIPQFEAVPFVGSPYPYMFNSAAMSGVIQQSEQIGFLSSVKQKEDRDGQFDLSKLLKSKFGKKSKSTDNRKFESKIITGVDNNGEISHRTVSVPVSDSLESAAIANHANETAKTKVLTASVVVELDPSLHSGDMVTLQTEVEADCGNWFIETVTHTVDMSGGFTEMTLNKNSTSKPVKEGAIKHGEKVNNTEGATSGRPQKRVYFGNDGNEI